MRTPPKPVHHFQQPQHLRSFSLTYRLPSRNSFWKAWGMTTRKDKGNDISQIEGRGIPCSRGIISRVRLRSLTHGSTHISRYSWLRWCSRDRPSAFGISLSLEGPANLGCAASSFMRTIRCMFAPNPHSVSDRSSLVPLPLTAGPGSCSLSINFFKPWFERLTKWTGSRIRQLVKV